MLPVACIRRQALGLLSALFDCPSKGARVCAGGAVKTPWHLKLKDDLSKQRTPAPRFFAETKLLAAGLLLACTLANRQLAGREEQAASSGLQHRKGERLGKPSRLDLKSPKAWLPASPPVGKAAAGVAQLAEALVWD